MRPDPERAVAYHLPRTRRRWPPLAVGLGACALLVSGQLAVAQPSAQPSAEPSAQPSAGTTTEPSDRLATGPAADPVPPPVPTPEAVPVPEVRVEFAVGAVLDEQAREDLEPALSALTTPGATAVVVRGGAEPGPDAEATRQLARQRAEVVAEALVEGGAPTALVRLAAEGDVDSARVVVVAPDGP